MTVTAQARVNAGAAQTGWTAAALGDTIQPTAASYATFGSPVARWELYDFPPAFTVPAGWSSAGSGDTLTFFWDGNGDPPAFVADERGCYLMHLSATEGGSRVTSKVLVDIPLANGLLQIGRGEGELYGGTKLRWTKKLKAAIDAVGSGGGATPAVATPIADAAAGVVGVSALYARQDHVHPQQTPVVGTAAIVFGQTSQNSSLLGDVTVMQAATSNRLRADSMLMRTSADNTKCTHTIADAYIQNYAVSCDLQSNSLSRCKVDADSVTLNTSAAGKVSICEAAAEHLTISFGSATTTIAAEQNTVGVGNALALRAQRARSGDIGGKLTIGGGDGGTPGTELAGNTEVQLGEPVANVTARQRFIANATTIADFYQPSSNVFRIEAASAASTSLHLYALGGTIALAAGSNINVTSSAHVFLTGPTAVNSVAPTMNWYDSGSALKCAVSVASTFVENFQSGVTCDRQVNGASRCYIDSNGTRLTGNVRYASVITPTALSGNVTDYNPTNFATASRLRIDPNGAARTINSMAAGSDGERKTIFNIATAGAQTLTLLHDDGATGTAAQRFLCANNTSRIIQCNGAVEVEYDSTSSRWRVIAP